MIILRVPPSSIHVKLFVKSKAGSLNRLVTLNFDLKVSAETSTVLVKVESCSHGCLVGSCGGCLPAAFIGDISCVARIFRKCQSSVRKMAFSGILYDTLVLSDAYICVDDGVAKACIVRSRDPSS